MENNYTHNGATGHRQCWHDEIAALGVFLLHLEQLQQQADFDVISVKMFASCMEKKLILFS